MHYQRVGDERKREYGRIEESHNEQASASHHGDQILQPAGQRSLLHLRKTLQVNRPIVTELRRVPASQVDVSRRSRCVARPALTNTKPGLHLLSRKSKFSVLAYFYRIRNTEGMNTPGSAHRWQF